MPETTNFYYMGNITFLATCSNGLYSPMTNLTAEWLGSMTKCASTSELINAYRQTKDDKKKRRLPVCCFQACFDTSVNKKGVEAMWRENHHAHLTGLVMIDVDHVDNPQTVIDGILGREDFKDLGILMIYITPSGEGFKVVFIARKEWGNLIDNQYEMAQLLGVTIDRSCKDAARASFIPKADDVKWLDERLFTYSDPAYDEAFGGLYRNKPAKTSPTQKKWKDYEKSLRKGAKAEAEAKSGLNDELKSEPVDETKSEFSDECKSASVEPSAETSAQYHGVAYSKIADELLKTLGEPEKGDRHKTMMQMGNMLSVICDNDPQLLISIMKGLPFVRQLIEERGLQEVERAMNYIADNSTYINPSKEMKKALQLAGVKAAEPGSKESLSTVPLAEWADEIENLMPYYPCLREICHGLPREVWPSALFVGAAFFGTLMTRCTYHYWYCPKKERRLNYSIYIIGDPASGKSFAVDLDRLILAPIKQQSKEASDAINRYKRESKERGTSSKAQEQDPLKKFAGINRYMPARTANGVFIESMNNAVEEVDGRQMNLHMVTFDSELTNSTKNQKGGNWINKEAMELKAFHNEEDGQNYANVDSYNGAFNVYWNYVYTGTPDALNEKVNARNFGTGLSTRLGAIPMPEPSFDVMDFDDDSEGDTQSEITLSEWAVKLDKRFGELPIGKLMACCREWYEQRMAIAKFNNEDKADRMLIQRVGYYGINITAPFIDMRHWDEREQTGTYQPDDIDERFCRLVMDIQYRCQHHFFGALAYNYYDNQARETMANTTHHNTRFAQCFKLLPEKFTIDQFTEVFHLDNNNAGGKQLANLLQEKAIRRTKRGEYEKLVANLS